MNNDIKDIEKAYESILKNKKIVLGEADISGIDELVYNPATKKGGSIGHGYDGGKKIIGITWSNHDNHLHIGFTNRDVAMAVIDKANEMGLKTTENPYAKKDPNGKVDKVHTSGSFHYKVFPGEPKVGAGVDISGNSQKITELIKWIETTYANASYPQQSTVDDTETSTTQTTSTKPSSSSSTQYASKDYSGGDPMVSQAVGQVFDKILSMKEEMNEATLFGGKPFEWGGGPKDHGSRPLGNWQSDNAWDIMAPEGTSVYSISDGKVTKVSGGDYLGKKGVVYGYQVSIDSGDNSIFYTHFGKISPNITPGASIKKGDLIGYIGKPKENDKWPTHVHIGLKSGDIKKYITTNAEIIGAENVTTDGTTDYISSTSSGSKSTTSSYGAKDYSKGDPMVSQIVGSVFNKIMGLSEATTKERNYLTFCNVSDPYRFRNGQTISRGQDLGKTDKDVSVIKYDDLYNKSYIKKGEFSLGKNVNFNFGEALIPNSDNQKIKSPVSGIINNSRFNPGCVNQITIQFQIGSKISPDDSDTGTLTTNSISSDSGDPILSSIISAPFKLFRDRYNEKGELAQKRWGYPGQKVDPWIVDTISAPFKKIGKIFKEGEEKKIQENIDRIKKLLK